MNPLFQDTLIVAFATLFATISPIDTSAIYAVLTADDTAAAKRKTAIKATSIAALLLFLFAFAGDFLLERLGVSLAAFRTGGGILLLLIGIEMVFKRDSGRKSTDEEEAEAETKQDISVFPMATPMIAGPGAMGATMLLMANTQGDVALQSAVILALIAVLLLTLLSLLLATQLQKLLGVTGLQVISRVFGVLLVALSVQFIFDGILESGLVG